MKPTSPLGAFLAGCAFGVAALYALSPRRARKAVAEPQRPARSAPATAEPVGREIDPVGYDDDLPPDLSLREIYDRVSHL